MRNTRTTNSQSPFRVFSVFRGSSDLYYDLPHLFPLPKERTSLFPSPTCSMGLLPTPPHDNPRNRRMFHLLPGEKAGMRASVKPFSCLPPHSKRWRAGPASSNLANHLGLRRPPAEPKPWRRLEHRGNGAFTWHERFRIDFTPHPKRCRAALAPAVHDALGVAKCPQASRSVWTAARLPPLFPERRAGFNRESCAILEPQTPKALFVYLVYFVVHRICITTSLTCFLSPRRGHSFPVSRLLDAPATSAAA